MRKILAALGIGMTGMAAADDGYYGKYETPAYQIEQHIGDAELRAYAPHIVAVVAVRGDRRGALNRGFRTLAGYIFGGNQGAQSVAMTSPVTQTQDGDIWEVTFMMPRQFTMDSLPAPNNEAVRFVQVPPRKMLVLTFAGRATTRALTARTQTLRQIARDAGVPVTNEPVFMFYDDPFTLPSARRNELAFEVE